MNKKADSASKGAQDSLARMCRGHEMLSSNLIKLFPPFFFSFQIVRMDSWSLKILLLVYTVSAPTRSVKN